MALFQTLTPRHRRFLAVLVVLFVSAAVWILEFGQRRMRVNSLIAEITASGGIVSIRAPLWQQYVASWRGQVVLTPMTHVVLRGQAFDDRWLREHDDLAALEIDFLMIDNCPMTAAGLSGVVSRHPIEFFWVENVQDCDAVAALLAGKRSLVCVSFDGTDLSDAGFRQLPLEELAVVSVQGTRVTPTGLQELKRCRRLGQLWLDGRQFDDRVAEVLRFQSQDFCLFLAGKDVTDAHLARLHGMPIWRVELNDTTVTSEAIASLKESLPDCQVRVYSTTQQNGSGPPG